MFIKDAKFAINVQFFGTHINGYEWFTVNGEPVPMREPYQEEQDWAFEVGDLKTLFAALATAGVGSHLAVETPCNFIFGKVNDFKVVKHTVDTVYGTADVDTLHITLDGEYNGTYAGLAYGRWMGVKCRVIGNPKVNSSLVGEIDWDKYRTLRDVFLAEKRVSIKEGEAPQTLEFLRKNAAAIAEALLAAPEDFTEVVQEWSQDNISLRGQIIIDVEEEDEEVAAQLRKLAQAIWRAQENGWNFRI